MGLCGAYNWLDCKASFEINPTGPNQPVLDCLGPDAAAAIEAYREELFGSEPPLAMEAKILSIRFFNSVTSASVRRTDSKSWAFSMATAA